MFFVLLSCANGEGGPRVARGRKKAEEKKDFFVRRTWKKSEERARACGEEKKPLLKTYSFLLLRFSHHHLLLLEKKESGDLAFASQGEHLVRFFFARLLLRTRDDFFSFAQRGRKKEREALGSRVLSCFTSKFSLLLLLSFPWKTRTETQQQEREKKH